MIRKIVAVTMFLLFVASIMAASAETKNITGYVEQIGRTDDVILCRLVETQRNTTNADKTIGYVRAKGFTI